MKVKRKKEIKKVCAVGRVCRRKRYGKNQVSGYHYQNKFYEKFIYIYVYIHSIGDWLNILCITKNITVKNEKMAS